MQPLRIYLAVALLVAVHAFSQTKPSFVGTWKLDTAQSHLGDEHIKSLMVVFSKDSQSLLSWRGHGIDDKGKPFSISWSGPEDDSMHPTMQNDEATFNQSAKREEDGTLVRHGEYEDGSFDARSKISADGNILTDEITAKSKDGKEAKETHVYHRVFAHKKPAA